MLPRLSDPIFVHCHCCAVLGSLRSIELDRRLCVPCVDGRYCPLARKGAMGRACNAAFRCVLRCAAAATRYACCAAHRSVFFLWQWSPALTISKVLLSICSMLTDPNPGYAPTHSFGSHEFVTKYINPESPCARAFDRSSWSAPDRLRPGPRAAAGYSADCWPSAAR